jgi:membrane-bound metal-dependent hydrolase YbcI (DUF457 family)
MTHEAVGAAVTLAVCAAVGSGQLAAAAAACFSLLGSRLPDADQPGTRVHRRTRLERRSLTAGFAGGALRLPMTALAGSAQHRGATHWLLSAAVATIMLAGAAHALWPPLVLPVAIGVGCGYCAHLLTDACTPHGAPLLGPCSARRMHLLPPFCRVPIGSAGDLLVLVAAIITATALSLLVLQST